MTEFETASLIIAGANATAAVTATAGIWYGIRAMIRANKERAGILDRQREADEHRHDEAMRRHDEAMQAGDQRHAEAMAALADQRRALEALIAGMETMIERTAPKPAPAE